MTPPDGIPEPDRLEGAPHPRETATLFGHAAAETAFLDALAGGRMPHAWLIAGPRGIGKATLAWRIARFMMTRTGNTGGTPDSLHVPPDAPVFRRVAALAEPGITICRRGWDEKTKRLKTQLTVDEVRALKAFFQMTAADGGWRVAIVDAADEMNRSAANALLKILEEPPARSLILLVCHRPALLLPTIRSRCRMLRLGPLGPDHLARALAAAGATASRDPLLAALSAGSVGEAIRLAESDGPALYGRILTLLGDAPRMDRPQILALADAATGRPNEARYDLTLRLTAQALARIARAGASGDIAKLTEPEARIAARLCPAAAQARRWAGVLQTVTATGAHARAVNLDPGQVILDMFLSIEKSIGSG